MSYFDAERPVDESVLRRMNATIQHRGPDGDGYFAGPGAGLAFQRLAIIDLERGWQPIYNEDRSMVICFNGEIYNHHVLREELKANHTFGSSADTEVILHGYEEWGESIRIVLSTELQERVMLPEFGGGLKRFLFRPNVASTHRLIQETITQSLGRWERRIQLESVVVGVDPADERAALAVVRYKVIATQNREQVQLRVQLA
jgi:phage baseplate assembly protein W